ncbi:MAG TPA: L-2-hydroxyglutarate oxidase [Solirubrobacteraceae bacterium]|jgi:2-hydroxyglutarate dehydrogenase|nr:L-2-hydroxyglutarate oxidase [Solirubrobacteraceae bacterium]
MSEPMCDVAVIGGGILGLAVARELARRAPGRRVAVLEREREVARHQTGHNSGVIHAGVYYAPGSLKAELCVRGAAALYALCARHGIAHEACGKLIVASAPHELASLDELERRGRANGVTGLRRLGHQEAVELEPHVRALAALHSPRTGIVDFAAVARALAGELREAGGELLLGAELRGVQVDGRALRLRHAAGELRATHAVFCAGAWADRLAVLAGASPDPRIVPFRGAYLRLRPERRELVRSLIYPVPDPALPFLGVHLTRTVQGEVLVGPTALLAASRAAGRRVVAGDALDSVRWPGTWRMARHWWRTGAVEIAHAVWRASFVRAAQQLVPTLRERDMAPGWAGVRAQAVARDGRLLDDFAFSSTERALHVRNAPSPGATSALAIAEHVADRAERELGL